MADINLLPENLRDKEAKERAGAGESSSPKFYNPKEPGKKPAEGSPPSRWQQLMSALTKNINSAKLQPKTKPVTSPPRLTPAEPIKSAAPVVMPPPLLPKIKPEPITPEPVTVKPAIFTPPQPPIRAKVSRPTITTKLAATLDVNLLPAQESKRVARNVMAASATAVVVGVILFGFAYFGLRVYLTGQKTKVDKIQNDITLLESQLETARTQTELAISTQHRLGLLAELLQAQGNWSPFFSWLENSTIKLVQLNNIAVDANGTITLSGTAPDLTEVGRQMLAYSQNQDVTEVNLTSVAVQANKIRAGVQQTIASFTFAIKVRPELFVSSNQ